MLRFRFSGRLPGLNEYIDAERTNRFKAAEMKKNCTEALAWSIKASPVYRPAKEPVRVVFVWYERNRKRDIDNIASFGHKVMLDALVRAGVLKNDGWANVRGFEDVFSVDAALPRIEVTLYEQGDLD